MKKPNQPPQTTRAFGPRVGAQTFGARKMKAELKVLKDRPKMEVTVTRDSVCAGDDCDAPHEKKIEVRSFLDPEAFANATAYGYLPSVAGVGHSWTCTLNGSKIAEISSSGTRSLMSETVFSEENRVHFVYHSAPYGNKDPAEPVTTAQCLYDVLFNYKVRSSAWLTGGVGQKNMIFSELAERSRSRTVSKIKEAITERSTRSKVHTEPAMRMSDGALAFAPDGLKLPLRWDFLAEKEPEQKNADSITLKFVEPAYVPWGQGTRIEFISFCWDCMIFRLSPPKPDDDWKWLASWFMRWFDPEDTNAKDEDGLYRVVHFVSDPEPLEDSTKFFVDFGSAKIDAFADLLDRVAEQGYSKCVIGDEKQPNQAPEPTAPSGRGSA